MTRLRTLVVVLGDQLDLDNAAFDDFDSTQDAVWMAEAEEESTHVWKTAGHRGSLAAELQAKTAGCRDFHGRPRGTQASWCLPR